MNFRKQFPLNLAANIISFIVNVAIGIFMVPYFIRHLGVEAYGFIPLATSVTYYVSLISVALNSAVSRFFTIDLQRGNIESANKFFNTAFWSLGCVSLVLVPLLAVFAYFTPSIFHIPTHLTFSVQWLFFLVLFAFVVTIFSSVFGSSLFALNRLDLQNITEVSNVLLRTAAIITFFILLTAKLPFVGWAYLSGAVASLCLNIYWWNKLTPQLEISWKHFDKSKLRNIFSMSSWLVLDQTGSLLLLQVDLIVCNLIFGSAITGQYAAIIPLSFLLRSVTGVFSSVFSPMVLISHAKDDKEQVISISQRAVKFMALWIAFPVGLLCGFAKPVLALWLGQEFTRYVPLVWILIAHLTVNLGIMPLFGVQRALNKVRWPAIVVLFAGILNVILAIILAKFCGWGIMGIAAAGAIVLTLRHTIFVPLYAAHILNVSNWTFIKSVWQGALLTVAIATSSYLLVCYIYPDTYWKLSTLLLSVCSVFVFLSWKYLLSKTERGILFNLISNLGR